MICEIKLKTICKTAVVCRVNRDKFIMITYNILAVNKIR